VRHYGYALLAVVVLVVAGLAAIWAAFPGEPALIPFVYLVAMWASVLIAIWLGLAGYGMIRSRFRRGAR
jgi:hypothetical protein